MVKVSRITRLKRPRFTRTVCSKASPVCTLHAVNCSSHQPPETTGSGGELSRLLASGELGLLCKSKPSQACVCTASFLCLPAFLSGGSLFPAPAHSSHLLGSFFFFFKASMDYNLFLNSLRQTLCSPVTALVAWLHNLPHLCSQHSTRDSQDTEPGMGQGSVPLLNE